MFRIIVSILTAVVFLAAPVGLKPSFAIEPKIDWKITSLGKPCSDPVIATNGLMYFLSGKTLLVLDTNGKQILNIKTPAGSGDPSPVFGPSGSIFIADKGSSVREIKSNGGSGWNMSITEGKNKSASASQLRRGPGNLLYLPLPGGLYAINMSGSYRWKMVWSERESHYPVIDTKREILACAGNDRYLYTVYGSKEGGYTLAAVNANGECEWRFGLGGIKEAALAIDPEGNLCVTANPTKVTKGQCGRLYYFGAGSSGSPDWIYNTQYNDLTAPSFSGTDRAYFCASGYLYAIDASNGEEIWRDKLYKINTRPYVDQNNDTIYLGTEDSRLLSVSSQGRLKWDIKLEGNVTVEPLKISSGKLYVATDKGVLYKITDPLGGD
ncbi:MAG: outer membrane protein assembly factor BamB family protein [Desulfocucumaceae bacterium]